MRYPKIRELIEAITAIIKGPYTAKFPFAKHTPEKRFRGRPIYYKDKCVGCKVCSIVCPSGCIKTEDVLTDKPVRRLKVTYESCVFCGNCQAHCITKEGIKLSNELDDLSTFDRKDVFESVEKDLVLCESCGCIIACKDHLLWIADKLGPLAYSSPTSYLTNLKDLKVSYQKSVSSDNLIRQDRINVLCHTCRRQITLNT